MGEIDMFLDIFNKAGITDINAQANILAQIKSESEFKPRSENLNYSVNKLQQNYSRKFNSEQEIIDTVALGPEEIGNKIYGGRMGNAPNEGYKYRGRGFIQHTGKEQYESLSKYTKIDFVNNPDLLNDPQYAKKSIPWFFLDYKKLNIQDLSDINKVNKAVGFNDPDGSKASKRAKIADSYKKILQNRIDIKQYNQEKYMKNNQFEQIHNDINKVFK